MTIRRVQPNTGEAIVKLKNYLYIKWQLLVSVFGLILLDKGYNQHSESGEDRKCSLEGIEN